jgi:heterodisulfide reductase subunit A
MSEVRLGLFLCDCGEEIASVLDMQALERGARSLPGVAVVRRLRYSCSPDGLEAIQSAIVADKLDRVLIAGCTPRTMERRLREACAKAGLDKDLCHLVDIRELCAWVHDNDPQAATEKAVDLVRMAAADLSLCEAQAEARAEVVPATLVIGGGVAGLTAALTLASGGVPVTIVEREPALGGMVRHAHSLYPEHQDAGEFLAQRVAAVSDHPQVRVLLSHQVTALTGRVGWYTAEVEGCGPALHDREELDVGAIIVATGAQEQAVPGLYGYDGRRVVTQLEFERELGDAAALDGLDHVAMILCPGGAPSTHYANLCGLAALKQATEVKALRPQADVALVFEDLRLPEDGAIRDELAKAKASGIQFWKYAAARPPVVHDGTVEVRDELSDAAHKMTYDRLVLGVPLAPQPDASAMAHMLCLSQDENGFFAEARYRLRPENCAERGIYVCGAAHYPVDWREAEFQAIAAAFRALHHIRGGAATSHAPVAEVTDELCTGCANCIQVCPCGAIAMYRREGILDLAGVDPLVCKGCGSCVVVCPSKAIRMPRSSDSQLLVQIDAALESANGEPRIVAFGCEWSGHAAAELAGAKKLRYPATVRPIRLGCSARIDPAHILWAFFNGADGVFVGACPPGDCHYVDGNRHAEERIDTLREMLASRGFDRRRLRLEWVTPDDPHDFTKKITDFAQLVKALGRVA